MQKIWVMLVNGKIEGAYVSEVLARADADGWRTDTGKFTEEYPTSITVVEVDVSTRATYTEGVEHLEGIPTTEALQSVAAVWGFVGASEMFGEGVPVPYEEYLAVIMDDRLMLPRFQFHYRDVTYRGLKETLRVFRDQNWDDPSIVLWFTAPDHTTNGIEPALVLPVDPFLVIDAARNITVAP